MATVQTTKRQNLAAKLVAQTVALTDALVALNAANTEYGKAGLTFVDADFSAATGTAHLDAATMSNLLGSITAINGFITANGHDGNMDKVRP